MARKRNCQDCKKRLTGKYYIITGMGAYGASRVNFCSLCCDKRKNSKGLGSLIKEGEEKVIEKEVGDKLMDDISEFEDTWEKINNNLGIAKINLPNNKTLLNSIRQARQKLEPYLRKPEIVEKGWLREYNDDKVTNIPMEFLVLFSKSAREEDYKQKVVKPTIEEILGVKLNEEINTSTKGNSPGVPGRADGKLKVNDESVFYNWIDHVADCRRLSLSFQNDNKLALQSFLRALSLKEKELKKELPEDNQQDNNDNSSPPGPSNNGNNNSNKPNIFLWISLSVGIILLTGLVVWFFYKKRK